MKESAIGEVLKIITPRKREPRTIRVCGCGTPMIWTFAFPYCERFCLNCGNKGGMLGTGDDVPATRDLIFKQRLVEAIWKVIYGKGKGLLPSGRYGRGGCKKDDRENRYSSSCDDHNAHLTKAEIEWNKIAREYMDRFKGVFTPSKPNK